MVNLSMAADTPFADDDAFNDFLGQHEISHQGIAHQLLLLGRPVTVVPLADTPFANLDWLLDHYQIHLDIAGAIGMGVPDLSSVNLKDKDQYLDWMRGHAALHEQINLRLGIHT